MNKAFSPVMILGTAAAMMLAFPAGRCNPEPNDPVCGADADCGPGEVCTDGRCVEGPQCTQDSECQSTEICQSGVCVARPITDCEEDGGYCDYFQNTCADAYFSWTALGCPGGRTGMCCLPNASCTAVGGVCLDWDVACPEGSGSTNPMDCPQGRSGQCCVPLE